MRNALCLTVLLVVSLILQAAIVPAYLPPVLRPDVGLLIGIAVLAFGSRDLGLAAIFLMGVNADMLGSGRFGLLTLCYLFAAGAVMLIASRELHRGDFIMPCIACIAGTAAAHGLYCAFGWALGLNIGLGRAFGETLSLVVGAFVWSLPVVYAVGKWMYHLRIMSPEVQARWANDERMNDAHKRQTA